MISKVYSSKILNTLIGVQAAKTNTTDNTLSFTPYVYLGLCAEEPNKDNGALKIDSTDPTKNSEPTNVKGEVDYGYARKLVSGSADDANQYFNVSSGGTIYNSNEIQFNTAKNDYPQKINYWFLAPSSSGSPFLWGEIKDVMSDKLTASNFSPFDASSVLPEGDDRNVYTTTITLDDTLSFKTTEKYIISWDNKDYKNLIPSVQEMDGKNITVLGNSLFLNGEDNDVPFVITYNNEEVSTDEGVVNKGKVTVYSFDANQHEFVIYALGINVKKNTVPTFFANELKASIDV